MRYIILPGVLLLLVLAGGSLQAQDPSTRVVRGTVRTADEGALLTGVTIAVLDTDRHSSFLADMGAFRLLLPRRSIRIVAARVGFTPDTVAVSGQDTTVHFRLKRAPVELVPILVAGERSFSAASSRTVRDVDIQIRPRGSSQELLRLAPGLVIAQHAGGGKAEQIFMRGFDADHGTDVAISVDGLPVNMVSHAHGQGYADLHFLMPELVERIEVRKGPYDVRDGDFATAGAVEFRTRDRIERASLEARGGSFGTAEVIGMVPLPAAAGAGGYVAASGMRSDGPFALSQRYRRGNLMAKWTAPAGPRAAWFAQGSAFTSDWDASGQVPQRAVDARIINRFGAIDPSEGGATSRLDFTAGLRSQPGAESAWHAQAFLTRYDFRLFSNFTFFMADSIHGDGIEQQEDRWIAGTQTSYERTNTMLGLPGRLQAGGGARLDRVDVGLYHQAARRRLDSRVDADISQGSGFFRVAQDVQLSSRVRLNFGARADLIRFSVIDRLAGTTSDLPHQSGTEWEGIVSPRVNVALDASPGITVFLNAGTGFHTNDARDVILATDETVLPRARAAELGVRRTSTRATFAAAVWALDLESELVYVGDEGTTEASGRTRRTGVDAEARVRLLDWLWADTDVNLARGRARDEPEGADRIPLAPEITSTGGLTATSDPSFQGGIRYRHISSRPADETNTVRAQGYTLWEVFAARRMAGFDISIAVDNLLDAEWNEAQFATTSRLRHEQDPVTELHFTPGAPRSIRIAVKRAF